MPSEKQERRNSYKRYYVEDDGPIYESDGVDIWDILFTVFIIVGIIVLAISAPAVMILF